MTNKELWSQTLNKRVLYRKSGEGGSNPIEARVDEISPNGLSVKVTQSVTSVVNGVPTVNTKIHWINTAEYDLVDILGEAGKTAKPKKQILHG